MRWQLSRTLRRLLRTRGGPNKRFWSGLPAGEVPVASRRSAKSSRYSQVTLARTGAWRLQSHRRMCLARSNFIPPNGFVDVANCKPDGRFSCISSLRKTFSNLLENFRDQSRGAFDKCRRARQMKFPSAVPAIVVVLPDIASEIFHRNKRLLVTCR